MKIDVLKVLKDLLDQSCIPVLTQEPEEIVQVIFFSVLLLFIFIFTQLRILFDFVSYMGIESEIWGANFDVL